MDAFSFMGVELLPICIAAVVVGALARGLVKRRGLAFLIGLVSTYAVVNLLYVVWGPWSFDVKFLLLFFLLPSLVGGALAWVIAAARGSRG